eukprot:scaffold22033_cov33-Phaeocystis_antarctica.AAC.2
MRRDRRSLERWDAERWGAERLRPPECVEQPGPEAMRPRRRRPGWQAMAPPVGWQTVAPPRRR